MLAELQYGMLGVSKRQVTYTLSTKNVVGNIKVPALKWVTVRMGSDVPVSADWPFMCD